MRRRLIELSAVMALFAGCQAVRTAPPSSGTVITTTNQVPATPVIPETKNLDRYVWGTPLYPEGTQSAYTVYLQNQTNPARFDVYGFDPKRNMAVFHGEGYKRTAARLAEEQIRKDLTSLGPGIRWGTTGQIDIPLPTPPGPPIDERTWAWQQAFHTWQVDIGVVVNPGTIPTQNPAENPAP